ncbi:unnamed protein product [Ectocarpus sp. CCAP 1310/34]|nr:unnamed protein product [Ectocarpus sp. CCAP 1310/34]
MELFLIHPGSFAPAYASLNDIGEAVPRPPNKQPKRTGRHGPGATRRITHLIPNENNNCFFNSALALALAAWDGQPLPHAPAGTPAAGSFFAALQLLRDSMFNGCDLSPNIVAPLTFSVGSAAFCHACRYLAFAAPNSASSAASTTSRLLQFVSARRGRSDGRRC